MNVTRCVSPADPMVLTDYWLGELDTAAESELEEHLFSCQECSDRLRELAELLRGIRAATGLGLVRAVVSDSFLQALERAGLRIREYHVPAGGSVRCTITPEDDLVVARLTGPLAGVRRADMLVLNPDGSESTRLPDIPLVAGADDVVLLERCDWLRSLGVSTHRVRLVAVEKEGERVLADYTFLHSPTPGA